MYPDNESHLSSKGNSPDRQSPSGGTQTAAADADEECHHLVEEGGSAAGLPNTINSSTMTCPECQYLGGWPQSPTLQHVYPYPYAPPYAGGVFCYPPYFLNPGAAYGCPYQGGATLHPPHCNNSVGGSSSGVSVPHQTGSVQGNSEHVLATNQNWYHPVPYPYSYPTPLYTSNHHMFLQSQLGLPVVLTPTNQNADADGVRSRNSLCSNCSTEIIPMADEDEICCGRAPLNITSFTDSMGRVWKCTGTRQQPHGKSAVPRGGKDEARKSPRTRVVSPSVERRDDAVLPLRKKRTKLRSRKAATEEVSVCTRQARNSSPTGQPQSKPSAVLRPARKAVNAYALTDSGSARPKPARKGPPSLKEESAPNEANTCKRGQGQEAASLHDACPKKPHPAEEPEDDQGDLDEGRGEQDACGLSLDDGTTKLEATTENPGAKYIDVETGGQTDEKASCNDFAKRNGPRSDAQRPQDTKVEDFWSSSSSSGTYDDSEAFDSFKLLNDAGVSAEAMRQSRQRSRDRLFRRRLGGGAKLSNAQSEEALKKRRRSASPRANAGDERPKEQVIVDTSQLRITEETPKRFVVESKDGASTSQKGMTITVQAEVPVRGVQCEFCAEGGNGGADPGCTCDVPPCQRPQWQAPPCPANEIHGTPVHHCHNAAPARPPPPQVHYQRHRRASSPPHAGESLLTHEVEEYRRVPRRVNLPNFGLVTPWNQRNADRPREENRHPHYIPPRPSTERLEMSPRREHNVPTNRTRRWHTQAEPPSAAETRSNRQAEEMLRIQIPNSFPRYRPYEYTRNHIEDVADAREVAEDNVEGRGGRTIDINIFRSGGVRRLGTVRRVVRCNSPRSSRGGEVSPVRSPLDEDPDSNLDFYRRPRSAITVSKTNYFSPRNRKLEEEVQRIQSANYGPDGGVNDPSAAGGAKEGEDEEEGSEYSGVKNRDDEGEFDGEKPDCDYEEEVDDCKRDPDRHRGIEDEED